MGERRGYNPGHELRRITDLKVIHRFVHGMAHFQHEDGKVCWFWGHCLTRKGYGRFWYDGQTRWAHRIAYAIFVGDIPELATVDHICHNPACCRPDHLRLVSYENNLKLKVHKHVWVHRTDGYEEHCTPAICTKCGEYGCRCNWIRDLGHYPTSIDEATFLQCGMPGNDHELEKSLCT